MAAPRAAIQYLLSMQQPIRQAVEILAGAEHSAEADASAIESDIFDLIELLSSEAPASEEASEPKVKDPEPEPPKTVVDLLAALEESVNAAAAHRKTRVTARWNVWSSTADENVWLVVVDSVTEKQARDAADQRNATAEKHGVASRFVAAPVGVEPNEVYAMLVNLLGNVEEGA